MRTTITSMVLGAALLVPQGRAPILSAAEATNALQAAAEVSLDVDSHVVVERYADGKIKTERQVALDDHGNFVSHGVYRVHAPDGHIIGTGTYRLGKKDGEWTREYRTLDAPVIAENATKGFVGPFLSTTTFHEDQLHGDWSVTDKNNRPLVLWQFDHGRRHGQWIWFNPDGTTRKQIQFENGQIAGNIVATDNKDKLRVLAEYIDGRELVREVSWHVKGKQLKSEGFVLKPLEHTKVVVDWWNGAVETQLVKREGTRARHGEWRYWHANGKLQMQGTYDHDQEIGHFVWLHENGRKMSEGEFVAGQMQGPWQTWYANGARRSTGHFMNGHREGSWMSWHENGMPKMQANYENGTLLADAQRWNVDGQRLIDEASAIASDEISDDDLRLSQQPVSDNGGESEVTTQR